MKIDKVALCASLLSVCSCHNMFAHDPIEQLFTSIYKTNFWQSGESVSGPGSELRFTRRMSQELSALLKRFGITSIADAPCGDCNWMRHVDIGDKS
jgi:hypothetical protein